MASGEKGKVDLLEDSRIDSGIDSFKSLTKDEHYSKPVHEPRPPEDGDVKDKLESVTEERHDSAYISSSITVDNITDIFKTCLTPDSQDTESSETPDHSEQEVELNLLTTITDDGDTYVFFYLQNSRMLFHFWSKKTFENGYIMLHCYITDSISVLQSVT